MPMKKTELQIFDIYIAAFLDFKGIPPQLENLNGKVIFKFSVSERLYQTLSEFNNDSLVPVATFTTHLKKLRSQLLNLRSK